MTAAVETETFLINAWIFQFHTYIKATVLRDVRQAATLAYARVMRE
jgi:hypothetical protein